MDLHVRHLTRYIYDRPVTFGPHRLMLRPRDSFDLRILDTKLAIAPAATMSWMHDAYGNSVAVAIFAEPADCLVIDSQLVIHRYASTAPRPIAARAILRRDIAYEAAELVVLAPFMTPASADPEGLVLRFAQEAVRQSVARDEHPLVSLSHEIHAALAYVVRHDEGTQAPLDTLALRTGACRDYAWLFIEAARRLGFAARFVSGYLHNLDQDEAVQAVTGESHAWAEVYLPGDGWIEFDPTNRLVADGQLIRVAVTRTPPEAIPVAGSYMGEAASRMEVEVMISRADPAAVAANVSPPSADPASTDFKH